MEEGREGLAGCFYGCSFEGLLDRYKMVLAVLQDWRHLTLSLVPLLTSGKFLNFPGIKTCPREWVGTDCYPMLWRRIKKIISETVQFR